MSRLAVIIELLLDLISEITDQVKKIQRKKAERRYQEEVLNAEKDITVAFNEHFSPLMRRSEDKRGNSISDKASDRSEKRT